MMFWVSSVGPVLKCPPRHEMIFKRTGLQRFVKVAILVALPLEVAALWLLDKTRELGVLNGIWLNAFVLLGILVADGIHYPAFKLLPSTALFDHGVMSQVVLFLIGYVDFILMFILLFPFYRAIQVVLLNALLWIPMKGYFGVHPNLLQAVLENYRPLHCHGQHLVVVAIAVLFSGPAFSK